MRVQLTPVVLLGLMVGSLACEGHPPPADTERELFLRRAASNRGILGKSRYRCLNFSDPFGLCGLPGALASVAMGAAIGAATGGYGLAAAAADAASGAACVGALAKLGKIGRLAARFADDAADATRVRQVGGRNPINSRYAGQTHPSGVSFTKEGFPDFSPHARGRVELDGLTGNYAKDAALANKAAGLNATPAGHVWHHVGDGRTMLLVPQDIHNAVRHTGGAAVIRHGGR